MICILLILLAAGLSTAHLNVPHHILNGIETPDAPWIARLQFHSDDFAYCSATLIKWDNKTNSCEGWLVTAASCLIDLPDGIKNPIVVLRNLTHDNKDEAGIELTTVNVCSHSNFSGVSSYENDIALIHVTLQIDDYENCGNITKPVVYKFNPTDIDYSEENAMFYGWGLMREDGPLQNQLYSSSLQLWADQNCINVLGNEHFKNESMLCAGEKQGHGPCSYATGGPLVYKHNDINGVDVDWLCGIASNSAGLGCGADASIFTEVSHFTEWIDNVIIGNTDICYEKVEQK